MHRNILNPAQLQARGKNAAAELFARRLIVPKIFFDAPWPGKSARADVLAVDRAGAGDIHVVDVRVGIIAARDSVTQLMQLPAHYKYVAILNPGNRRLQERDLYAGDGLGESESCSSKKKSTANSWRESKLHPSASALAPTLSGKSIVSPQDSMPTAKSACRSPGLRRGGGFYCSPSPLSARSTESAPAPLIRMVSPSAIASR